jgi:hypothetical protein
MGKYDGIKLDKSRPFGIVYPPEWGHYDQDGFPFDADGSLCEHLLDDAARARLDKMLAHKEASAAAERARRDALMKAGIDPDEKPAAKGKKEPVNVSVIGNVDIDLKGWAKGEVNYPWFSVRQAAMKQFSRDVDNARALVEFLIDEGVVNAAEVKRAG